MFARSTLTCWLSGCPVHLRLPRLALPAAELIAVDDSQPHRRNTGGGVISSFTSLQETVTMTLLLIMVPKSWRNLCYFRRCLALRCKNPACKSLLVLPDPLVRQASAAQTSICLTRKYMIPPALALPHLATTSLCSG